MSDDRLILALERLDRALKRLDDAGVELQRTGNGDSQARVALEAELADLDVRHQRLRASAATAVEQLDRLIAATPAENGDG